MMTKEEGRMSGAGRVMFGQGLHLAVEAPTLAWRRLAAHLSCGLDRW